MNDLISKQEVKEILRSEWVKLFPMELDPYLSFSLAMEKIENIPSAEPKKAKWSCSDDLYETAICTACDWNSQEPFDYILKNFNFCPNCGSKMEASE